VYALTPVDRRDKTASERLDVDCRRHILVVQRMREENAQPGVVWDWLCCQAMRLDLTEGAQLRQTPLQLLIRQIRRKEVVISAARVK
jgi:hypothetical protein